MTRIGDDLGGRRHDGQKRMMARNIVMALILISTSRISLSVSWPHRRAFFARTARIPHRTITELRAGDGVSQESTFVSKIPHVEYPEVDPAQDGSSATTPNVTTKALILMDTFCDYHGLYLAERARQVYGVATISVLSDYMAGYFTQQSENGLDDNGILSQAMPSSLEEAKSWLQNLKQTHGVDELVAVICESDPGLAHAEQLGEWLNVRYQNDKGPSGAVNESRRNKYLMMETLRAVGVPVIQQKLCRTEAEARDFAQQLGLSEVSSSSDSPTRVVVKPIR
jgi:hypothetical protein